MSGKRLIVNADDFGFTRDVNAGIIESHRNGILTATTLMANGEAFEDAVQLAKANPNLDIGVHLVLVGGPGQPTSPAGLMMRIARRQVDLVSVMQSQVRTILKTGLQPSHLDTHKHTHLARPVLDAVVRISQEFQIPWVRKPSDFPVSGNYTPWNKRIVGRAVKMAASRFNRILQQGACKSTDHFTGFQMTGSLGTKELLLLLRSLPEGLTELMCHPGYLRDDLRAAPTRLKESREIELRALTSPEARAELQKCGIRLVTYRDL